MTRVWMVGVAALSVATPSLAQDLGPHFRKISDGIYVQSAREVNSNVGIILTSEGVVLIDSGQTLIDLAADRSPFEARALLRLAGREIGATRLVANPSVVRVLEGQADWLDRLARQVGGAVTLRADPSLAMSAGYAECT